MNPGPETSSEWLFASSPIPLLGPCARGHDHLAEAIIMTIRVLNMMKVTIMVRAQSSTFSSSSSFLLSSSTYWHFNGISVVVLIMMLMLTSSQHCKSTLDRPQIYIHSRSSNSPCTPKSPNPPSLKTHNPEPGKNQKH